ncbi:efflux RND transporter periplasmic adaptor subunit [Inquilinus sp. CAU 1745]|uniref:efflux RND transporter periplasmic adaptor subunit n=1 Tax=Inquilinus sp. CAU 1745 TaxID=3140369 RepID=UPI00325AE97F
MIEATRLAPRFRGIVAALTLSGLSSPGLAQAPGAGQAPPPAVVVERIEIQEVSNPAEFNARVEAIEAVDIRARVQGFLRTVDFEAGSMVEEGNLLFEIEPDQYQIDVASAEAQLSRAEAARLAAEQTLDRTRELVQRQTVAQATLDDAQAAFDIAGADVEVAQAALRAAELNLSYTRITTPITGRIGRATYTQGNLVGPESGALARVVQLDPIRVVFSVTEGLVTTLRQQEVEGPGAIDPNALNLTLRLPNGTDYEQSGQIEYIETEVNPRTGTVAVRITFPNPDHLLIPNQYVTLTVRESDVPALPVVPQTAVLQDRDGRFVYVLGEDNTVSQHRITTGARVENGWAVTEGLSGGEPVIVQGIQRLSEGMAVQPSEGQPSQGQPVNGDS